MSDDDELDPYQRVIDTPAVQWDALTSQEINTIPREDLTLILEFRVHLVVTHYADDMVSRR
jgi:hypothetical protein